MEELSDQESIRLFVATGEPAHFARLYQRHGRKVFLACYGFFQDAAAAEDCAQETFLRAMEKADRFHEGDVVGWLLRVARNICIDSYRKRRPEVDLEGEEQELSVPVSASQTGGGVHLTLMQLRREIQSLPVNQQRCLELKINGYSYEETATAMGLPADAVRSHLQNARRTLRLRMQEALSEIA
jgi:RNA polymerase sigma-70 factor (ECF subfamily)